MMESFALYLFRSAIWLTGFSIIYFLFLRNERFFLLKRIYLISGLLISFIFPLITIHYPIDVPAPQINPFDFPQNMVPVSTGVRDSIPESQPDYKVLLLVLYLAGMLILILRFLKNLISIYKAIGKAAIDQNGSARLIRASEFPSSFSFFNYVFINPSINDAEVREIMNHELVHVNQKHWLDLLLAEILRMMQWVNPFAWVYARFIRLNHEYLADEVALQRTSNPASYRAALINQLFGSPVISLSNSFNYSLNKKRFDMMKTIITSPYRKMKLFLILPVFAIILYAFATPEYKYIRTENNPMTIYESPAILAREVRGIVINEENKPMQGVSVAVSSTALTAITDQSGHFAIAGVPQKTSLVFTFPGYKTIIKKPDFSSEMKIQMQRDTVNQVSDQLISIRQSLMTGGQAAPLIIIDGVENSKGISGINANDISTISVLKDQSATAVFGDKGKNGVIVVTTKTGGLKKNNTGSAVNMQTATRPEPLVVIDGQISEKTVREVTKEIGMDEIGTYTNISAKVATEKYGEQGKNGAVEIMTKKRAAELGIKLPFRRQKPDDFPTFMGKSNLYFKDWVASQLKYPEEASAKGIKGWVQVNFTVEPDGKISNVKPFINTDPVLGEAVAKVISSSPPWEPAKNPEAREPYTSQVILKFTLPDMISADEAPFVVVERMPMYPGGEGELLNFIAENTRYPAEARANKIEGRVILRFIVNKEGNVEDVTVLKGVDPQLDAEAVRVAEQLKGFVPGSQGGRPVNVWYMIPVNFVLSKEATAQ